MHEGRYIETEEGVFLPEDDPDSAAGRMSAHEISIRYAVGQWLIIEETSAPVGELSEGRWLPVTDQPPAATLRLKLKNDRRRLHTIRAEGSAPIKADFELVVRPSSDGNSGGYVRHLPPKERADPDESDDEALTGTLAIPAKRLEYIVGCLKHPGARLKLSLELPLYKPAIAHDFDRDWYSQDFYLRHDATTPITGYHLNVLVGPLRTEDEEREAELARMQADDEPQYGGDEVKPDAPAEHLSRPAPDRDPRLTWIIALLTLLVIAELFGR
ncbi:hypothetical protein [Sphingosinicella sp. BN140058]|uniref:hypothetical protein n=1 Tax=Sphingosinicella sp. BN140058 TaxID=1892855 RepID=UPI0010131CEB|nr:hypothetical protein [Sphingosinicella sp. BN140058]QAY77251.1 hypothetical protein ETR14_12625 [Sphingosinicella sp. BN140058]